jgi:hypothetical protein
MKPRGEIAVDVIDTGIKNRSAHVCASDARARFADADSTGIVAGLELRCPNRWAKAESSRHADFRGWNRRAIRELICDNQNTE